MKKVSVKDFIIGALAAMLFMMLLGAGYDNEIVGRYTVSSSNSDKFAMVCVTDSLTGDTRCMQDVRYWNDRTFSFKPKFQKEALNVTSVLDFLFPISASSVRQAFIKACSKAEIEDFHFHDLRHTFATRLVQNGVDLYKVKELLGHKTITMTMRYSHHYPESLRSSVEVLDGLSQSGHNDDFAI